MLLIVARCDNHNHQIHHYFFKSRKGSSYHPGVETITTLRALFANPLVSLVRLVMLFVFAQWRVITVFYAHNGKPRQATGAICDPYNFYRPTYILVSPPLSLAEAFSGTMAAMHTLFADSHMYIVHRNPMNS